MAKRFIDTGLFDDSWFMDLSKDSKILWLYLITKCDHAGIIDLNEKLCKVQTGITDIESALKQLANRCHRVREQYHFIPKFVMFQYPNFPESSARAQLSVIDRLRQFGLLNDENNSINYKLLVNSYQTDSELLDNSTNYNYSKSNSKIKIAPEKFYEEQLILSGNDANYSKFIDVLFGRDNGGLKLSGVLSMPNQVTFKQFTELLDICKQKGQSLLKMTKTIESKTDYYKGRTSPYLVLLTWLRDK